MEEQKEVKEMNQTQQPSMVGKQPQGMTVRESSTSYSTEENTVITWKPTLTDQKAHKGKQALQQYSLTSPDEENY